MKAELHTYPVIEAFKTEDECPFCNAERTLEQHAIDFVVGGGSYMERGIREMTDKMGFCTHHMKMMHQFGNSLGNALILQTYVQVMQKEFSKQAAAYQPKKRTLLQRATKQPGSEETAPIIKWAREKQSTCFICDKVQKSYERYMDTFFGLLKDSEFRTLVEGSKGFCMRHFTDILEASETKLPQSCEEWFYPTMVSLMEKNMTRVKEDMDWFIAKHDYRYQDESWKNSMDSVPRMMLKIKGFYPADPPYKGKDRQ